MRGALVFGSTLISLILLEVFARIVFPIQPTTMGFGALQGTDYYRRDAELAWVPNANIQGRHDRPGSFESTFSTNSRGLRDREHALERPDGVRRIVAVGDSYTWGFGVDDDEVFTERIESMLDGVEVINLGVIAYQLWQEILYFQREGLLYDPDVLLVALCMNDIYRTGFEDPADYYPAAQATERPDESRGLRQRLAENSALYNAVVDRVNSNRTLVEFLVSVGIKDELQGFDQLDLNLMPSLIEYPEVLDTSFEATLSELRQFQQVADEVGVRLIVAVVPALQAVDRTAFEHTIARSVYRQEDFDLDKPYRLLSEFGEAEGIEFVIPLELFREVHGGSQELYLHRDQHWNELGHELFAQAIVDYLRTNRSFDR
jgi:hypothetical protein